MNSVPHITVLMPVYNAGRYLREAIDSILSQSFTNFEFLIINDGSSDNSEEIIKSYTDTRIRYIKNETNIKLIATLNKGIDLATGKYIARMDADDTSENTRLQVQYEYMEQNPDVALCGSWFKMFGDKNIVVKYESDHNHIMAKMLYQCHFCHPSVIMRKQSVQSFAVKFDPFFIHAEDYDFFTRIGEKHKLANIQQVLLNYRTHAQSISQQNKQIQDEKSIVIKKRLFKNIGLTVSEADLELYRTIGQHEYGAGIDYLQNTQQLLEKMLAANEQSGYFEKDFFRKLLSSFWLNVIYNSNTAKASLEKYYSSFLSKYQPLSAQQKLKFRIKSLLKK